LDGVSRAPIVWPEHEGESVDDVLARCGRFGGPSTYGWHTRELGWRCPRAASFVEAGHAGPGVGKAAWIGSVVHEYLAGYYQARSTIPGRMSQIDQKDLVETMHQALMDAGHLEVAAEARRLYDGYLVRFGLSDPYLMFGDVVGVEEEVRRDLPWGEPYTARLDMRVVGRAGTLVVDHKITGQKNGRFIYGWRVSPQILGIQWIGLESWLRPIVVSINGIIRTKQIEFNRRDVTHGLSAVKDWLRMLYYKSKEREMAVAAGSPPDFAQCFAGWRMCPFIEHCTFGIEPRESATKNIDDEADEEV